MIAGGTGITPMYQVIKAVLKQADDETQLALLYANQSPDDILLFEELQSLAEDPRLRVWYTGGASGRHPTHCLHSAPCPTLAGSCGIRAAVGICRRWPRDSASVLDQSFFRAETIPFYSELCPSVPSRRHSLVLYRCQLSGRGGVTGNATVWLYRGRCNCLAIPAMVHCSGAWS